jgi:hypothetical protein
MSDQDNYRTEAEIQASTAQEARVSAVLAQAVQDAVSGVLAVRLGESQAVVEHWVDAAWEGLRNGLPANNSSHPALCVDDRLAAVMLLLGDRINAGVELAMSVFQEPTQ